MGGVTAAPTTLLIDLGGSGVDASILIEVEVVASGLTLGCIAVSPGSAAVLPGVLAAPPSPLPPSTPPPKHPLLGPVEPKLRGQVVRLGVRCPSKAPSPPTTTA